MPENRRRRPPHGTSLGFDFGLRRIGVAVGQTATRTAAPLTTLTNHDQPDWAAIEDLVCEWRPSDLVVGLPLDADGKDTTMSRQARCFGRKLHERTGITVYYADERLTSRAAEERFTKARAAGGARRKDARRLDAVAAAITLENWLQSLADAKDT